MVIDQSWSSGSSILIGDLVLQKEMMARIFGFLGLGFSLASMVLKDNKSLLRINIFAALWWGLNGFFLGSLTSLVTQIIGAGLAGIKLFGKQENHLKWSLAAITGVIMSCGLTWDGWNSIPVTAASVAIITAIGVAQGLRVRYWFFVANSLFLVHAMIYGAYEQIITCVACYIAIAIGIVRMKASDSKKANSTFVDSESQSR